ncbi:hypothetical protein QE152_g26223 [Popillia japonica]|uniref:Zn-dependent metallo-hydrolase RNA specificity domain-containing protein n=1 Tax=Popillia japonica TaxID=7064 RepID=A0AAW1JZF7_POPJA
MHISDKEEDWGPDDNVPLNELMEMLKRMKPQKYITAHGIKERIAENPEGNIMTDEEVVNIPMEEDFNNDSNDAPSSRNTILDRVK